MAKHKPIDWQAAGRQSQGRTNLTESEERLDSLLAQAAHPAPADTAVEAPRVDPLDPLRQLFAKEFAAVITDLQTKYRDSGVQIAFDVEKFIRGGRTMTLIVEFCGQGSRLEGTVLNGAIAFQQTRYLQNERSGITGSGPTLRTRDLTPEIFRGFVCERIAALVRSALRHHC